MMIEIQTGASTSCLPCPDNFIETPFLPPKETNLLLESAFKELKTACKESNQLPSQLFVIQDHKNASPTIYQLTFEEIEDLQTPDLIIDDFETDEEDTSILIEKPKKEETANAQALFALVFPFFEKHVELNAVATLPAIQNSHEVIRLLYAPIENTVETLITTNSLSTIFITTYIAPHSPFHNLEISLELFDTHPRSVKIEFSGHPETIQKLLPHLKSLQEELQKRFQTIEIPTITAAYQPLFPSSSSQQKSSLRVSSKKEAQAKIVIKSLKQDL
jgi:hypothetical protein